MGIWIFKIDNHRLVTRPSHSISGFTLLEVMVALAIIATVLISVYKLHTQSLTLALETRFNGIAPFLAQQKLAELATEKTDLQENESGDFGEDFPDFSWQMEMEKMEPGFQEKTDIGFAKIDLTVFTNDNKYRYNLRTYRLMQP
jgi:general secretion pathway protein I